MATTRLCSVVVCLVLSAWVAGDVKSETQHAPEAFAEPFREVIISSVSEPERVTSRDVGEGDAVRKGQLLATLDTSVLRASLAIARKRATMRGRILAAEAEYEIRERLIKKLRQLRAKGHATQAELERAELDFATAKASLMLTREEQILSELDVTRIEAEIERRTIRSPIDGVVSEVHREVGEVTQISDPRLLTLVQLHPLKVKFSMAVAQADSVAVGDIVRIDVDETNSTARGQVDAIAPVLDATSGTVKVTCVIDNAEGRFSSGMRCRLMLDGASSPSPLGEDFTFPVSTPSR